MNNKKLGTAFEKQVVRKLTALGYWVHFLNPDPSGAQPFDVIAIKGKRILAIDCKTCKSNVFSESRLEENQKFAFDAIMRKTCAEALLMVEHDGYIHVLEYEDVDRLGKIRLDRNEYSSYYWLEEQMNED